MTRLESHRQKIFYLKITGVVVGIVVLIGFLLFFGMQFIINSTLYFSGLNGKNVKSTDVPSEDFFGTFELENIPNSTNSAELLVSGSQTNFNKADVYLNKYKVDTIKLDESSFSYKIIKLKKGSNEIYFIAKTLDGKNIRKTNPILVRYTNEPPKLEISTPSDGETTNKTDISIIGSTSIGASIQINTRPIVVDSQGNFQTLYRMQDGENQIIISSIDDAGNRTEKMLKVIYKKDD
ncbi:MAG: hypothetical protein WCO06_07135 [Candidatus Roizmanbacteria bacterium]